MELVVWKITEALNAKGALLRILNLETEGFELKAAYGLSEAYLAEGPVKQQHLILLQSRPLHVGKGLPRMLWNATLRRLKTPSCFPVGNAPAPGWAPAPWYTYEKKPT